MGREKKTFVAGKTLALGQHGDYACGVRGVRFLGSDGASDAVELHTVNDYTGKRFGVSVPASLARLMGEGFIAYADAFDQGGRQLESLFHDRPLNGSGGAARDDGPSLTQ